MPIASWRLKMKKQLHGTYPSTNNFHYVFLLLQRLAWNWLQNTITMSHPLTEQEISSWPISYCPIKFLLNGK